MSVEDPASPTRNRIGEREFLRLAFAFIVAVWFTITSDRAVFRLLGVLTAGLAGFGLGLAALYQAGRPPLEHGIRDEE
jgi:hypothetical protein